MYLIKKTGKIEILQFKNIVMTDEHYNSKDILNSHYSLVFSCSIF